ncbi:hypothetical protein SA21189_2037 [Staphylococcus aureus subsp. aureus 21189]|nr:hypothetical protein SA21189_2037 [Staphylococcus aureus subsp. aureus 21189]
MKLKSFITVTLALGMIATTGATVAGNEVSAAEKDKLPATQKAKEMQNVPYTIDSRWHYGFQSILLKFTKR